MGPIGAALSTLVSTLEFLDTGKKARRNWASSSGSVDLSEVRARVGLPALAGGGAWSFLSPSALPTPLTSSLPLSTQGVESQGSSDLTPLSAWVWLKIFSIWAFDHGGYGHLGEVTPVGGH